MGYFVILNMLEIIFLDLVINYTDEYNSLYFSETENIIRMISSILGRAVCKDCVKSLYL